jgi:ATP-binding cassette, subfamily B, multidrug efflux pump
MKALQTLNPYFFKHKKLLFWGFIFIVLSNFLSIYQVQFVGESIDDIKGIFNQEITDHSQMYRRLLINVGIIIAASLLSGLFRFLMRQTIIVCSRRIEYEIKNKIYHQYQALTLTSFKKNLVGDLLNRLSEDVAAVRMYLGPGVMYVANLIIMLIITSIYMFMTDVTMTLWVLLPLPILSVMIYKVSDSISKKSKKLQKDQAKISTFVQDSFSGIRIINFFNLEDFFKKKYHKIVLKYQNSALDVAKTEAIFFPMVVLVIGLSNVAVLYIAGHYYLEGKATIGVVANFFMYINILVWPCTMVGWVTSINQRAEAAMQRLNEFLHDEPDIQNLSQDLYPIKGDIEFRNVSYTYPNTGIEALKNISFTLKAGQSLGIMGKTGSGKSTIALLLCRLIDPSEGEILIDGKALKTHNLNLYRQRIGYVPQESYLFSESIYDNIAFAMDESTPEMVELAAKKADVHKNIIQFKDGYQSLVGERGVMLSGGQKQRLCIARALIKQPEMMILDDCLSALDSQTEANILRNMADDVQNSSAIIISHRSSSFKNVDILLTLDEGRLVSSPNAL